MLERCRKVAIQGWEGRSKVSEERTSPLFPFPFSHDSLYFFVFFSFFSFFLSESLVIILYLYSTHSREALVTSSFETALPLPSSSPPSSFSSSSSPFSSFPSIHFLSPRMPFSVSRMSKHLLSRARALPLRGDRRSLDATSLVYIACFERGEERLLIAYESSSAV